MTSEAQTEPLKFMLQMPVAGLAYKYVLLVAMIAFINHYGPGLHVLFRAPLSQQEIQRIGVRPAKCDRIMTLYGGGIMVSNYSFGFSDGFFNNQYSHFTGYFVITKLEDDGMTSFGIPLLEPREASNSLMERASRMKYIEQVSVLTIDTLYK